jgi:hypothetical protein
MTITGKNRIPAAAAPVFAVLLAALAVLALSGCEMDGGNDPLPPYEWTPVPNTTIADPINGVAWGNNKFLAVGGQNPGAKGAVSSDGTSWTAVDIATGLFGRYPSRVAFLKDRFVASTGSGGAPRVAYSEDGVSWTATGVGFGCKGLAYGNNVFVVGGQQGKIAYSTDADNWTELASAATTFTGTGAQGYINAIVYGSGRFVAGGGKGHVAVSTNGADWTGVTGAETIFDGGLINGMAYGNGRFVAVGGLDTGPGKGAFSIDGSNWYQTQDIKIGGDNVINGVAFGGGYFIAVDSKGAASYSSDGITWTLIGNTTFGTDSINGAAYGYGKFVMVGGGGKAALAAIY